MAAETLSWPHHRRRGASRLPRGRTAKSAAGIRPAPSTMPPSGNGWTVIATLIHRPGRSTLVHRLDPDIELDAEAWSRSDGWCEHCCVRRPRRITALVRHVDGRLVQVGSTCLHELLGRVDDSGPLLGPGQAEIDPAPPRGLAAPASDADVEYDRDAYLAHVAQAAIDSSFVPSSAGRHGLRPTWCVAEGSLGQGRVPGARADQRAQEALAWVRDELAVRAGLDSFERRLVETLSRQRLSRRELPTAAAAIYRYHQHLHHLISARKRAGAWIGEPGSTMTAVLTVDHVERVATPSGPAYRHHLTDALGRHATWDNTKRELDPGAHRLQVTVDKHRAGKPPLTILTRCEPA